MFTIKNLTNSPKTTSSFSLRTASLVASLAASIAFGACLAGPAMAAEPSQAERQSPAASVAPPAEKVDGLPFIGNITLTFDDVSSVAMNSFGFSERERSIEIITGATDPVITVAAWPAGADAPITTIKALSLVSDNAAPELAEGPELDLVHTEKTAKAIDACQQAALLASSRPDKYSLAIHVKLRSVANFVQNANPGWPNMSFLLSEEYFSCRVFRD